MSISTGSRLSSYMRKSESLKSRFTLPEKLKGGRVEKYVNYWKGVKTDYKEALKELAQSSKQKPIKATLIGGTFLFAWYANHHNPDEESFKSELIKINNDLTAVPESHRNRVSTNHQVAYFVNLKQEVLRRILAEAKITAPIVNIYTSNLTL